MKEKLIKLGYCQKLHGIKGAFVFCLENEKGSVLKNNQDIYLKKEEEYIKQEIKSISFGNKVICYLENIQSRNDAENIIPFDIYIKREDLPALSDEEIYMNDLIGMKVFAQNDEKFTGEVLSIVDNGVQDILVIKNINEEIMVPFVSQFVKEIDEDKKEILIILPEYLE